MHPGPMNRGVEIASEVADLPQSVITEQVTNGIAIRMSLLYLILGGGVGGASYFSAPEPLSHFYAGPATEIDRPALPVISADYQPSPDSAPSADAPTASAN